MNNVYNNHPLINNSNQYFYEKKYVSIHSEDRDFSKYPNSAEFEIMLPQELLNIASARLYSWSFPANYNVFSVSTYNVTMTFKFIQLYNPGEHQFSDPVSEAIFAALYSYSNTEFILVIEPGFYNPDQMSTELTNKFNTCVTNAINTFLNEPENAVKYAVAKSEFVSYDRFRIVYNSVSQKLWFGNTADKFVLTNASSVISKTITNDVSCVRKNALPEWANWGLPAYLGFSRCDTYSYNTAEYASQPNFEPSDVTNVGDVTVPRFFYGDAVVGSGDNGFWLIPTLKGATVYFLQAPYKISFMGPSYIYMEVDGMNCIDETSPWNFSNYTVHNNQTNGVVNSAFAKIAVPTTPISQWFDSEMGPYKYWNPPAERISKLKFRFRYHNGRLVEFGQFEFTFMLEFNLLRPQQERSYSIRNAYDLGQNQAYSSKYV